MGPNLTPAEGKILGTAGKMFTIAGPVIVYGVDNGRMISAPTQKRHRERCLFNDSSLFLIFWLYVFEISVGFADHFKVREGVGIFGKNFLEVIELVLVDDADQGGLFAAGISAYRFDLRTAVVQMLGNIFHQRFSVRGNDGEFIGGFCGFQQQIAHERGQEAVDDTQCHGLIIQRTLRVNKHGSNRHNGVQNKRHKEKVGVGTDLVDITGNNVRSAGGGVVAEAGAVNRAAQHTAENDGINGIVTQCVILDKGKIRILQQQKGNGIDDRKQQRFHSKILLHEEIRQQRKGHIDEQRHIADAEACLVLDHGSNAIEACGCKAVCNNEHIIDKGQ